MDQRALLVHEDVVLAHDLVADPILSDSGKVVSGNDFCSYGDIWAFIEDGSRR